MPRLVVFVIVNALEGLLISIAFTGLILAVNLANLRHLFLHTADGPWALGPFCFHLRADLRCSADGSAVHPRRRG